jgi:hypothetical protein
LLVKNIWRCRFHNAKYSFCSTQTPGILPAKLGHNLANLSLGFFSYQFFVDTEIHQKGSECRIVFISTGSNFTICCAQLNPLCAAHPIKNYQKFKNQLPTKKKCSQFLVSTWDFLLRIDLFPTCLFPCWSGPKNSLEPVYKL